MDWHELEKTKVTQLREMAKEKLGLEGTIGMTKEHLVEALAKALNIEKPHKVVHGAQKTRVKQEIKALKAARMEALETGTRSRSPSPAEDPPEAARPAQDGHGGELGSRLSGGARRLAPPRPPSRAAHGAPGAAINTWS